MKMDSFKSRHFIGMENEKENANGGMKMDRLQVQTFYRNGKLIDGFFTTKKKLQFLKIQRYFRSRIIGENYTLISDLAKMIHACQK